MCAGIQLHVLEYKFMCLKTDACAGERMNVVGYKCVVLEYNYMCWKTDASARIQLRMQKYKCMCWNICWSSSLTKHAYDSVDCHNMAALEDIFFTVHVLRLGTA